MKHTLRIATCTCLIGCFLPCSTRATPLMSPSDGQSPGIGAAYPFLISSPVHGQDRKSRLMEFEPCNRTPLWVVHDSLPTLEPFLPAPYSAEVGTTRHGTPSEFEGFEIAMPEPLTLVLLSAGLLFLRWPR